MINNFSYKHDTRILDENVQRVSKNKYSSYEECTKEYIKKSSISIIISVVSIITTMYLIYSLIVPYFTVGGIGYFIVLASVIGIGILIFEKISIYIGKTSRAEYGTIFNAPCEIDKDHLGSIYDDVEKFVGNVNRKDTLTIKEYKELLEFRQYLAEIINDNDVVPEFLKK